MIRCKCCQLASCTCGKEDWEDYMTDGEAKAKLEALQAEVAARDLVVKQMREALSALIFNNPYNGRFSDALALQPSTEALDAYVAEKVAAEREECAKVCESLFDKDDTTCNEAEQCAAAIRKINELSPNNSPV